MQFSEGMLGPSLFALDLKTSILCIVFFTALSCIPPAYCAVNGPRTGMRQMVQARYALGYWPALICGFLNCLQFIGFMSLTVILGGQSLSLASKSEMSWTVGIIVVSIISLLVSLQHSLNSRRLTAALVHRPACAALPLPGFLPDRLDPLRRHRRRNGLGPQAVQLGDGQGGLGCVRKWGSGLRSELDRIHRQLLQLGF